MLTASSVILSEACCPIPASNPVVGVMLMCLSTRQGLTAALRACTFAAMICDRYCQVRGWVPLTAVLQALEHALSQMSFRHEASEL